MGLSASSTFDQKEMKIGSRRGKAVERAAERDFDACVLKLSLVACRSAKYLVAKFSTSSTGSGWVAPRPSLTLLPQRVCSWNQGSAASRYTTSI